MKYLLLASALCLAGCASHQFAQPSGAWKTRTGQLQYKEGSRAIIGELALSTNGDHAKLEFSKGPGLVLMSMQRDATHARFEGPLSRLAHTVKLPASPDSRHAAWLNVVELAKTKSVFGTEAGGAKLSVQLPSAR